MYETKPMSEVEPACRLIDDELPPNKDVWLISKYGHGFRGTYNKHSDTNVVAWAPLPKLTEEQRAYIIKKYAL